MRLEAPEGYTQSGASEDEIREQIPRIPTMTMLSTETSRETRKTLLLAWWEVIALAQKDRDEEEAREINENM